jgi:hypothetical protein
MSEVELKSYRYLRITIVFLLLSLAVTVIYQTARQNFLLLDSISAYYYTPAQSIFVGALIGLGACMITLRGTTDVEDVFLNLGGMFAMVVAVVPTTRGDDFRAAVRACEEALGPPPLATTTAGAPDCPTVQALVEATRANVDNNVATLLIVGGVGLLVTVAFALADRARQRRDGASTSGSAAFLWGILAAFVLWLAALVAMVGYRTWLIDNGHYIAAVGLFVCIFIVTVANAFRRDGAACMVRRPGRLDRYAILAWVMAAAGVLMATLWLFDVVTAFWPEAVVTALFLAFWIVQTLELLGVETAEQGATSVDPALRVPS